MSFQNCSGGNPTFFSLRDLIEENLEVFLPEVSRNLLRFEGWLPQLSNSDSDKYLHIGQVMETETMFALATHSRHLPVGLGFLSDKIRLT